MCLPFRALETSPKASNDPNDCRVPLATKREGATANHDQYHDYHHGEPQRVAREALQPLGLVRL